MRSTMGQIGLSNLAIVSIENRIAQSSSGFSGAVGATLALPEIPNQLELCLRFVIHVCFFNFFFLHTNKEERKKVIKISMDCRDDLKNSTLWLWPLYLK